MVCRLSEQVYRSPFNEYTNEYDAFSHFAVKKKRLFMKLSEIPRGNKFISLKNFYEFTNLFLF